jgi:hypothetical protein
MSAEASPQEAAAGETAPGGKKSQRKRRWETLGEVVEVARDNAESYLRDTVLFATVLFVVAIAQRFKVRAVRVTTTVIALALAGCTVAEMLTLPRA